MSCSNCFNGCTEITSDKCVKYTGADIPALGIQNGDTLQFVEQALAQFLISALDGSGIKPIVDLQGVCSIVANNIPVCVGCSGPTLNDLLQALIDSACDLQDLINDVSDSVDALEQSYDEGCLTVVRTSLSNTHNVLQAVIDQLCQTDELLGTTILSLNNYVLESELANLVVGILEDEGLVGPVTKQYTKMVPYTVIPWFAPDSYVIGKFDGFGRGYDAGEFQYIYLCNGLNNTPDMRGRVPAGLTDGGMLGITMDAAVNPASSLLNPTYSLGTKYGDNYVTLGINEIPAHGHTGQAVSTISPNPHSHTGTAAGPYSSPQIPGGGGFDGGDNDWTQRPFTTATTNLTCETTITIDENGFNGAHTNTQPTIGCYYIMYIPAP